MKSELILKMNQQCSVENMYSIGNIKSQEQLVELRKQGYLVDYTKESWEKEYPSIPAENMFCVKCEVYPMGLHYMDMDHGIVINTGIYGKDKILMPIKGMDMETCLNHNIKEKMEYYKSKRYVALLLSVFGEQNGNLILEVLSHLLENEKPSAELYEAFISIYTGVDRGCERLSKQALKNLIMCKSEKQKEETKAALEKFGDQVCVYRGQGKESAQKENALSWTTDKNVALFFATRFGEEQAVLLKGVVSKEHILEYEELEKEVIVLPEYVTVTSVLNMMDRGEFASHIWDIKDYVHGRKNEKSYEKQYHFNRMMSRVLHLYEKYGDTEDHGEKHSCRVTLLANALYAMNAECQCSLSDEEIYRDYKRVMDAAIYHDIGRTHGFDDADHGKKSYQIYRKENGDSPVVRFLIENHCISDEEARVNLEKSFPEKDWERTFELLGILKDADALDRVRFGHGSKDFLNVDFLHEKEAIRLVGVANFLQTQSVEIWRGTK